MPNQLKADKRWLSLLVKRELFYRVEQYVTTQKISKTEFIRSLIETDLDRRGIELSKENKKKVAQDTQQKVEEYRNRRNRLGV